MIEIINLYKQYGKETILDNISIKLEGNAIYGLIGANGCGKTTLLRCICGLSRATKGKIIVMGKEIGVDVDFSPSTGIIIETPGFIPNIDAKKNLTLLASISGKIKKEHISEMLSLVGLDPNDKTPICNYSLGMRQRLGLAQALMEDPRILLLDEPFNGLDNNGQKQIRLLLRKEKERGKLIIMTSHQYNDLIGFCDQILKMEAGKLIT